jgi:hypothetical protein
VGRSTWSSSCGSSPADSLRSLIRRPFNAGTGSR